jgi:hypothetical protein
MGNFYTNLALPAAEPLRVRSVLETNARTA